MEKFYIVTSPEFLGKVKTYKENVKRQNEFIKEFYAKKDIYGAGYFISGTGMVNAPFDEHDKKSINLYIDSCSENEERFGSQLKKERVFSDGSRLRPFRKNSAILKDFQDLCIKEQLVINLDFPMEGDYFRELLLGGYSITRFECDGNYYLRIKTDKKSITPIYEGFVEIKGSEFYAAKEKREGYQKQNDGHREV